MKILKVTRIKKADAGSEQTLNEIGKHLFEAAYKAAILSTDKDKRVASVAKIIEKKTDEIRKIIENFN